MSKKNSIIILIGSLLIFTGILGWTGTLHFISDFVTFDETSGIGLGVIGLVVLWVGMYNVSNARIGKPTVKSNLAPEDKCQEDTNLRNTGEPAPEYEFDVVGNLKLPANIRCANCGDILTISALPCTCSCGCVYSYTQGGLEWSVGHGTDWRKETRTGCPHCGSLFTFHTSTTLNTNKAYCTKCNFSRYESD